MGKHETGKKNVNQKNLSIDTVIPKSCSVQDFVLCSMWAQKTKTKTVLEQRNIVRGWKGTKSGTIFHKKTNQ